ncbi:hypothetical protein F8388_012025 [Cannabis sativa]|uniref:Uncharacterized protein n=1 Tax=Cannabis sativa TaxID=3483 RepID=A0A7J6GDT2_CANSA|nr:hypothetical protein F8388_012025 [Cannabis sativa]
MEISRPEHASSYPTEVYQRQYPQFLHHNSLQASQHNLIIIYYKLAQPIKEIVPLQSRLIALRLLNILNILSLPPTSSEGFTSAEGTAVTALLKLLPSSSIIIVN